MLGIYAYVQVREREWYQEGSPIFNSANTFFPLLYITYLLSLLLYDTKEERQIAKFTLNIKLLAKGHWYFAFLNLLFP